MNEAAWRVWFRSSPWWGALGGILVAASVHLLGHVPEYRFLYRFVDVRRLFEASPVLGYAAFVALGTVSGWVFRRVEDRLVLGE